MSGKEFFIRRYEQLGWRYREVELRPSIRINTMNVEAEEVLSRLESQGVRLDRIPFVENGFWVEKSRFSLGATAEYLLGLYSIQEAAAQIPATVFSEMAGKTVLDACAAPGGKTVQLADLMRGSGAIVALDAARSRLPALANHLERCHVGNAVVYHLDARVVSRLNIMFDRVLLDVPCSGNSVTDRAWFERRTLKDVERNVEVQRQILAEAVKVTKPDGEIVYSTCSLELEENEVNMDWATKKLNLRIEEINCHGQNGLTNVFGKELDSSVAKCRRIWPETTQGFFVCKLRKAGRS
jgi:NOL1/NOP2/sun family putative RNA methylase